MSAQVYRSLLRLYPHSFRSEYGDDLVQHFDDLSNDRGLRAAWARTAMDLIVTVPRYRLENLMSENLSATAISVSIWVLVAAGVVGTFLVDLFPGVVLLVAAGFLAISQRSALARSLRTPDSSRRRQRLRTAAVLGAVFVLSVVSYGLDLGDDEISGLSLVLHNAIGAPAMLGALGFLVAGLCTPRSRAQLGA